MAPPASVMAAPYLAAVIIMPCRWQFSHMPAWAFSKDRRCALLSWVLGFCQRGCMPTIAECACSDSHASLARAFRPLMLLLILQTPMQFVYAILTGV